MMLTIKFTATFVALGLAFSGLTAIAATDTLGWTEGGSATLGGVSPRAVNHGGEAQVETRVNGKKYKRAHGWTTWPGVYHYTRARIEKGNTVVTDSFRVWGSNGTEAYSPWAAFTTWGSPGTAKTYYGN